MYGNIATLPVSKIVLDKRGLSSVAQMADGRRFLFSVNFALDLCCKDNFRV